MIRPTYLRLEHHRPGTIGIGEEKPRLSWSFEGEASDWIQTAYELQITWTDGKSESVGSVSKQSCLVPWPWRPLQSRERVSLQVRVFGPDSLSTSPWSEPVVAEAGLLKSEDWSCQVIEPEGHTDQLRPVTFERKIKCHENLRAARLYITAHGVYEAHINGRRVGDHVLAPGWTSYKHRLIYQTFDVTDLIQSDAMNDLQITVAEGWFCGRLGFLGGRRKIYGDSVGAIAMLVMEYQSGSIEVCGTDSSWRWTYGPHLSSSLYDGEAYNSRIVISTDSVWHNVRCRAVPSTIVAPDGPPVRRTEELRPKTIFSTPSGKTIVDFGQNFAGRVRININLQTPCTLVFQHAEVLENEELGLRPLRGAAALDTLIIDGKREFCWEPAFTYHGFRYVQVEGWPETVKSLFHAITGVVIGTDMERTGYFTCSNSLLNKLHQNIVWSMRGNFLSIPTDCPQRDERLGWTGDINVFSDTANYLFDTSGMLSSWLRDVDAEQRQGSGIVSLTVPNVVEGLEKEPHAIWGDMVVMLPWSLYQAFGDREILGRQFSSMESWLRAIPRSSNGLWNYTSDWKLGDWLDPAAPPDDPGKSATDPILVSDAFLVHTTGLMVEICDVLDHAEKKQTYEAEYQRLRCAFTGQYITPSGRLAADTQTAHTLALQFGLYTSSAQIETAAKRLEWLVRRISRFRIATGFAGTPFLGSAMTIAGLSNLFYRMLLNRKCPSWLFPVTMGATTVWERWDSMLPNGDINPGEMTSFNHYALGSVAHWMHKTILGLSPLQPGWSEFAISPIPGGGLTWAEGSFRSSYGVCHVRWEIQKEGDQARFWMRFVVPPNTRARVTYPSSGGIESFGSGTHVCNVPYTEQYWPPRSIYARYTADTDDEFEEDGPELQ